MTDAEKRQFLYENGWGRPGSDLTEFVHHNRPLIYSLESAYFYAIKDIKEHSRQSLDDFVNTEED